MPRSKSKSILKERNGIYSYFMRGTDISLNPDNIKELKKHATKIIEGRELMLIVGKNWIVVIRKIHMSESENIYLRCFGDICEPNEEMEPREVIDETAVPVNVVVECMDVRGFRRETIDYNCRIKYDYVIYDATIAITVDPRDIEKMGNDEELQLLLDLLKTNRILVRPM
jgi:hypothetical protein